MIIERKTKGEGKKGGLQLLEFVTAKQGFHHKYHHAKVLIHQLLFSDTLLSSLGFFAWE